MLLRDILRNKGAHVLAIRPEATLQEVVETLVRHRCGSLVVCPEGASAGPMLGIITERDILRALAARQGALDQLHVADVMTTQPVVGSPDDTVAATMGLLTERRIRHLPLLHDGQLAGMISIGDLVKAQHDEYALENHYMKSYIQS